MVIVLSDRFDKIVKGYKHIPTHTLIIESNKFFVFLEM